MSPAEIRGVIDAWVEQFQELGALSFINWVQIFENQGAMMGASNPHPHGQVWANLTLPNEPRKESAAQADYFAEHQRCLLCSYLELELKLADRNYKASKIVSLGGAL